MSSKFKLCTFKFYRLAVSIAFYCCENDPVQLTRFFGYGKSMLKRKKYFTSLKNEIAFNNYKIWDVLKNTKECMLHFATIDCIEINWTFWDKLRVTMERVRENFLCECLCR